ncbi:MAG: glucuronate isomerase [Oscillospiraceae bacterium]|nr:glucuronate isomerase [Oscillospiraceae bacterium]
MRKFMDVDFLLQSETAKRLYAAVENLPIIDWHCHLDPQDIARDKVYTNLTELWLKTDHYKWRAMRACGIDEEYITGAKSDFEKFKKWAAAIEHCIGNPLYHWTHLELQRVFDCYTPLSAKTAKEIWEHCKTVLKKGLKVSDILQKFNVEAICTSDDPCDTLEFHRSIAYNSDNSRTVNLKPTFRPSALLNVENPEWSAYIGKLSDISRVTVYDWESLIEAAVNRVDYFNSHNCNMADHALDPPVYVGANEKKLNKIITKALTFTTSGERLTADEINGFKTEMLIALAKKYNELGWSMQLHMGAARQVNTSMTAILGADKGYDCMGDENYADALAHILDRLEISESLPRTFLFGLNPKENDLLTVIAGCFQGNCRKSDKPAKAKVQVGPAWWFNDHKDGIELQLRAFANNGVLAHFAGMLTDSRSYLSYARHEYFRRILCNLIGTWVENGEYPADFEKLEEIVKGVAYYNARGYFLNS